MFLLSFIQAHLRRHSQVHTRMENYNPRQRRLRNLVVDDENAAGSSSPSSQADGQDGPGDLVNLVTQTEAVVVGQVVSACAGEIRGDQASYSMTNETVDGEQTGFSMTDGGVEQGGFTVADVMEQSLLVTDACPILQSSMVVELSRSETDGEE